MMKKNCLTLLFIFVTTLLCCVSFAMAAEVNPGQYKVGEDIPPGSYTIINESGNTAQFHVYKVAYKDFSNNGLLYSEVLTPTGNTRLDKVVLEDGNIVDITYSNLSFYKYAGITFDKSKKNTVFPGRYTVGEDIPAGSYSVTNESGGTSQLHVYRVAYRDFSNNGLLVSEVFAASDNKRLGKITLEDGNIVDIIYSSLIFEPYKGISFDSIDTYEAENSKEIKYSLLDEGTIKSELSDQGISASRLFSKNQMRILSSVMIIADLTDEMGSKGPLPFESIKALIKNSSWIGITKDQQKLILLGYYNNKESLIILNYNPKGIIDYQVIENPYPSDDELIKGLPSLFSRWNVTEYYEITGEEKYNVFEELGVKKIRRMVER